MTGTQKNNDAIEITQLLEDERAESGTHHTHVSMRNPKGSFRLSRVNLDKLNALLCRYNEESFGSGNFGLAEKGQGNFLPILVDVDLKVPKEVVSARLAQGNSTDRVLYSMVQIKELVTKYQSILRNICEQDMDDKLLACVVLEKPMYTQDVGETSYVKNGFHLHFPFLFLDRKYIRVHVYTGRAIVDG